MDRRDHLRAHGAAVQQPMHIRGRHTHMVAGRLRWSARPLVATLAVGILALVPCSQAADFACAGGDVGCLIEAINTANANGDANTITLEAGTYTLTAAIPDCAPSTCTGLPLITSLLTITGGGADNTIIERDTNAERFRILSIAPTGTLTLQGLTLRGGDGRPGGGIWNNGTLTLIHTTVTTNFNLLGDGGGIYNTGTLALVHTTVTANRSGDRGGGLFTSGTVTIADSVIADNSSTHAGVGLYILSGTVTLSATTVTRNRGGAEGAGITSHGTVRITQSAITNNSAILGGAGLWNAGTLSLENSTVDGNESEAADGGGMLNYGTATVINSTVSNNLTSRFSRGGEGSPITVGH